LASICFSPKASARFHSRVVALLDFAILRRWYLTTMVRQR